MFIKLLKNPDIPLIVKSFEKSGWQIKPASIFEQYLHDQETCKRVCFVALIENDFAGYFTLKWLSDYKYFANNKIPEISDLNVLPNFRNKGIGSALIKKCEKEASKKSNNIGVGLYPDYEAAQRLYVNQGYLPDGRGATYNYEYVAPGKQYPADDDLVIWFTKNIQNRE